MGMLLRFGTISVFSAFVGTGAMGANFGYSGTDGDSGRDGRNGDAGQSMMIIADGSMQSVITSGRDGSSGADGYDGRDASSCYQPMNTNYNLEGADGGRGGYGGNGGSGGNAGDITVYFTDPAALRQVMVNASGGSGAQGGWGGRGGDGCHCQVSQWTIEDNTYYCQNGNIGSNGAAGSNGRNGVAGTAYLIERNAPLPVTTPRIATQLSNLVAQDQNISREIWTAQSGAAAMFARGSRLADRWQRFMRIQESVVALDWQAARDSDDFAQNNIVLSFSEQSPQIAFDDGHSWFIAENSVNGDNLTTTIKAAILKSEVNAVTMVGAGGRDTGLVLKMKDQSGMPPELETKWHVHYYTKGLAFWRLRFEGDIPSSYVHVGGANGDEVTLEIGRLNIHPSDLRQGVNFRVELTATRTFGGHKAAVNFDKVLRVP